MDDIPENLLTLSTIETITDCHTRSTSLEVTSYAKQFNPSQFYIYLSSPKECLSFSHTITKYTIKKKEGEKLY